MSTVEVKNNSPGMVEIEIRPAAEARWFWLVWALSGGMIFGVAWYQLGRQAVRVWPISIIVLTFSAIVFIKIWQAWGWGSHGLERLALDAEEFTYTREGSIFDRTFIRIRLDDITGFTVLSFGLGDSWEPNRIQVKTKRRSLYIGRNLSKAQGDQLSQILSSAVPASLRARNGSSNSLND